MPTARSAEWQGFAHAYQRHQTEHTRLYTIKLIATNRSLLAIWHNKAELCLLRLMLARYPVVLSQVLGIVYRTLATSLIRTSCQMTRIAND